MLKYHLHIKSQQTSLIQVKISNIQQIIFKQLHGYAIGGLMKLLSTLVLFFIVLWIGEIIIDYTVGFILAVKDRLHWWTIRKLKRLVNRIVKK